MLQDEQSPSRPGGGGITTQPNSDAAHKFTNIRPRILIPLSALVAVLVVACGLVLYSGARERTDKESAEAFERVPRAFRAALAQEAEVMDAALEAIAQDTALRSVFLAGDIDELREKATPLFQRLRETHSITHFYFHSPDLVCVLRVHKPEKAGGKITRFTARTAETEGRTSWGIELGSLGTLPLRVVRPWYEGKRLIGYLELGVEIDHVTKRLSETMGMDFIVTVHKSLLNRRKWEEGMRMLGRDPNWDLHRSSVIIDQTIATVPQEICKFLCDNSDRSTLTNAPVSVGRTKHRIACDELQEASGRTVGELVMLRDVTAESASLDKTILQISIVCVLAGTTIVVFFYFLLGRLGRELTAQSVALRQNDKTMRALLNATDDVALLIEPDGTVIALNGTLTEELGIPEAEIIGKSIYDLLSPELVPRIQSCAGRVARSGKMAQFEEEANGRWLSNRVYPIKNAKGDVTRLAVFAHDVTQRKQSEQERNRLLYDSQRRIKELACMYGVARSICRRDRLVDIFQDVLTMIPSGWSYPEIARGRIVFDDTEHVLEPFDRTDWVQSSEIIVDGQRRGVVEVYYLHQEPELDEGPFVKEERDLLDGLARALSWAVESKEAEDALQRAKTELEQSNLGLEVAIQRANQFAEEAAAATMAKSDFLANMSHEIRTPMNGIIGMTGLLLDTRLDEDQHSYAEIVRTCGNQLLTLINDILDFSKIEANKLDLEMLDFDLRVAVEDVADMLTSKADEKNIEFHCFIDPEVPPMLRGDPGRLRQVLTNLVGNALKFTEQGQVDIQVTLDQQSETHATVRFEVHDTGIGIPADRMDRLFQSFSQVDASTTRKYGGTGLGLAISKRLTEKMGGQIGLDSKEHEGSTFWFTAVLAKQPLGQQPPKMQQRDIEGLRVLVVDDNSTNRHILQKYLTSWNCRPSVACSGAEAMDALVDAAAEGDPFRIALLDYCMPGENGESLGRRIKQDERLKDVALVMFTSMGKRGDANRLHQMGFAGYLIKPIKQAHLWECLRTVVGTTADGQESTANAMVTRYTIAEQRRQRLRILVVEDSDMNQAVALRILDKKLGHSADAVANGKEALKALAQRDYDIVLMDCQMPEMDGYEATIAIRDPASDVKNHSIPIVAMTAHAMTGDRQKCLDAGMDDYVTKPINVRELDEAINRHTQPQREAGSASDKRPDPTRPESDTEDAADVIYSEFAEDPDMADIIDTFVAELPSQVSTMWHALRHGDHDQLRRLAHQMKGSGGSYGYPMLSEAAKPLEEAAKAQDTEAETLKMSTLAGLCGKVGAGLGAPNASDSQGG